MPTIRVEVVQLPPKRTWQEWMWLVITFLIGMFVVTNRMTSHPFKDWA